MAKLAKFIQDSPFGKDVSLKQLLEIAEKSKQSTAWTFKLMAAYFARRR